MKSESVQLNDIEMYYETEGSGEPLLLLHGGTGCHENWVHAGRELFVREYTVIEPDARGHGRTTNPQRTITHQQCALDALALLDHLGIRKCRAIGLSMGGNTLLHMAALEPERIEAMIAVSATMYFPEQARAIMRQITPAGEQAPEAWATMRKSHKLGGRTNHSVMGLDALAEGQLRRYEFHAPGIVENQGFDVNRLWRSRSPVSG